MRKIEDNIFVNNIPVKEKLETSKVSGFKLKLFSNKVPEFDLYQKYEPTTTYFGNETLHVFTIHEVHLFFELYKRKPCKWFEAPVLK